MSWETRKNKTYYYQKKRVNGRVTSQYLGRGKRADIRVQLRVVRTEMKWKERARVRALREHIEQLEQPLAGLDALVSDFTRAGLLVAGCHTHKGQWRRKRAKTIT